MQPSNDVIEHSFLHIYLFLFHSKGAKISKEMVESHPSTTPCVRFQHAADARGCPGKQRF